MAMAPLHDLPIAGTEPLQDISHPFDMLRMAVFEARLLTRRLLTEYQQAQKEQEVAEKAMTMYLKDKGVA